MGGLEIAVFVIAVAVGLVWLAKMSLFPDPQSIVVFGRDFVNFWFGGERALNGDVAMVYDRAAYQEAVNAEWGRPLDRYAFSYPPHALLLLAPFGLLSYLGAWCVWTAGGYAAFHRSVSPVLPRRGLLWLVLSPAGIVCVLSGQTGLWIAALWFGGLLCMRDRPIVAGILFGLLTVKPQYGPLLVLALIVSGQWRTIVSAAVTTLLLVGASILAFGVDPWMSFVTDTIHYQKQIISEPYGVFDYMVPSWFKWAINLDMSVTLAWWLQGIVMVGAALGTIVLFRSKADRLTQIGGLSVMAFLFSPYVAIYDMTLLILPMWLIFVQRDTLGMPAFFFLLALPMTGFSAALFHIPLTQLCLLPVAAHFVYRAVERPRASARALVR